MTITVQVVPPHVLGRAAIYKFAETVADGGEVSDGGLVSRIREAAWLAIVSVDGKPVGVGALKRPTPNHVEEIEAHTSLSLKDYAYELGWIVIDPRARGQKLSRVIVKALLEKAGTTGVFCTVRAENFAIQKACDGFDFTDTGKRWAGVRGDLGLGIWRAAA